MLEIPQGVCVSWLLHPLDHLGEDVCDDDALKVGGWVCLVGYDPWVGGGLVGAGCAGRRHLSPTSHWWRHQLGWWQPHTKSRDQEVQGGGASILKPTPRLNHRLPQGSRATKLTPLSKVPCVVELPPPPSSSKLTFKESSTMVFSLN